MVKFRPLLLMALLAPAGPAAADSLYRCEGADGSRSYSSRAEPGGKCQAIATYAPTPASTTAPPSTATSTSTSTSASQSTPVRFRTAPAGETLAAPSAPAGGRVSRGAVYKYERDGITHYTNVRPGHASQAQLLFTYIETCFACAVRPGVDFHNVRLNTQAYRDEIRAAAQAYQLDEALVRAVIHAESAFDLNARSHKGAQGLMQLMPATAERFGVADPYQAGQNIRGGSEYLAWLLERYHGDSTLAAAAYNAGEGAVDRHGGVPPFAETQRYVERVNILTDRYRTVLAGAGSP